MVIPAPTLALHSWNNLLSAHSILCSVFRQGTTKLVCGQIWGLKFLGLADHDFSVSLFPYCHIFTTVLFRFKPSSSANNYLHSTFANQEYLDLFVMPRRIDPGLLMGLLNSPGFAGTD
jgi:hypothetical protein